MSYAAVNPGYSYNYTLSLCEENATSQLAIANSPSACSAIYILDVNTSQINRILKLRHGEQIHDIDIDPNSGKIYAAGEYNYLENDTAANEGESIRYEDDVVYVINGTKLTSHTMSANDIRRIRLYGELEEGGGRRDVIHSTGHPYQNTKAELKSSLNNKIMSKMYHCCLISMIRLSPSFKT